MDLDSGASVSFLPMEAIGDDGSLELSRTRVVAEVAQGFTYFENGDISIAKITSCFENGKGAVMADLVGGAGFGTTELIVARPEADVDPRFLYYLTQSMHFRLPGEAAMLGAGGQKRVPDLYVKDFEAAWPPTSIQVTIATYLDAEVARIDALSAAKRDLLDSLTNLKTTRISEILTGAHAATVATGDVERLTAGNLTYIGEWHTHPVGHGSQPSMDDRTLLRWIGDVLVFSDVAPLMLVAGADGVRAVMGHDDTTCLIPHNLAEHDACPDLDGGAQSC